MGRVTIIGIDLAKSIFHLQGNDTKGNCIFRKKLSRPKLLSFFENYESTVVCMEACCGAHQWARKLKDLGHDPKLISPQFVKPFVKGNKNDWNDTEAICEAAARPGMRFVTIKSEWQTDLQAIQRVRSRLSYQRTAILNEMRGIIAETGIVTRAGARPLKNLALEISHGAVEVSQICRMTIADLHCELIDIEERIDTQERRLKEVADAHPICGKLMKISGIGIVTATAIIAAVGNAREFKNGRHFAAWLGLVPRHSGTGGRNRIGSISKRGDKNLRCLLVHGARSSIRTVDKRSDRISTWAAMLKEKHGYNKAAVALANKNARIIWSILANDSVYDVNYAASAA